MEAIKALKRKIFYSLCGISLEKAARYQGLADMAERLEKITPDITDQYTSVKLDSEFARKKARILHAFQISLVDRVIREFYKVKIVDIGDSAGTHLGYIKGLYQGDRIVETLSVNPDAEAVKRIEAKGLTAMKVRGEDLGPGTADADICLSFETLEHLMDPCVFLHRLSVNTKARYLILTVPYMAHSRVGLYQLRRGLKVKRSAEMTHMFELSPEDWKLIVKHSGWAVGYEKVYLQYPKRGFFSMMKGIWKRYDFEGFYGLILKRDDTWSSLYTDW